MVYPTPFSTSAEELVTFNFVERVLGAQVTLYLSRATDSAAVENALSGVPLFSEPLSSDVTGTIGGVDPNTESWDFDIIVDKLLILEGKAYFTFLHSITGTATTRTGYTTIKLRKWDGTTETEIANVRSRSMATSGTQTQRETVIIDVPKTRFQKGDYVRISVEPTADADGGGAGATAVYTIYHDPENAAVGGLDSDFIAILPILAVKQ